jgi:hypothetical protein
MAALLEERLALFDTITLKQGSHQPDGEYCAMEFVAYLAGEPWSDSPECCSPLIATFMRSWNDALRTDEERTRLLKPLLPRLINTRADEATELRRSWIAFDWLVRECTTEFLSLTESLRPHANALRSLPQLDQTNFDLAVPIIDAAVNAAVNAARNAARNAAGDAAWNAAWNAARDAAVNAARDAAWNAAWNAARNAAGDAAGDAAVNAARDAAVNALQPSVERLQQSALCLVDRMIEAQRQTA